MAKSAKSKSGPRKDITVALDAKTPAHADETLRQLKAKGFVMSQSLEAIGVLTGSAPESAIAELKEVDGVASIEENRTDYKTQ